MPPRWIMRSVVERNRVWLVAIATIARRVMCAIVVSATMSVSSARADVLVLAPSSMTEVAQVLAGHFEAKTGTGAKVSVASTGHLARQLEAGVPADIFMTANREWLDWSLEGNLLVPSSVRKVAGNYLVVAVRGETENWANIEAMVTLGYFAMGDPAFVPAGRYAKSALTSLGLWEKAKTRAVLGENVRVALQRLLVGEVEAAIVYESDLVAYPGLRIARTFSPSQTGPIAYFAALTSRANAEGASFLAFLSSPKALEVFRQYGFTSVSE